MGKLGLMDNKIGEEQQCIIAGTGKVQFDTAVKQQKMQETEKNHLDQQKHALWLYQKIKNDKE